MILMKRGDVEFYDILSDPVLIIGENDKVIYCNSRCAKFLRMSATNEVINQSIHNFIKFPVNENVEFTYEDLKVRRILNTMHIKIDTDFASKINVTVAGKRVVYVGVDAFLLVLKIDEIKEEQDGIFSGFVSKITQDDETAVAQDGYDKFSSRKNDMNLELSEVGRIIDKTSDSIVAMKRGKIIYSNDSFQKLIKTKDCNDIIGKEFIDIIQFDIEEKESIISDITRLSKTATVLSPVKRRLKLNDGRVIDALMKTMSFKKSNGDIIVVYDIKDISGEVKVNDYISKVQATNLKILEFLPFGVVIVKDGKMSFANENILKMLRLKSLKSLNEDMMNNFLCDESKDVVKHIVDSVRSSLDTYAFQEIAIKNKNGKKIAAEIGAVPMVLDNVISVVIIINDISERKRAERDKYELEQAIKYDKLKTEFISNVSHELKTPLNIILSIIQLLQLNGNVHSLNKEAVDKYMGVMKQNCFRLLRLINNMIDITRIEVGYLKMDFGNYDIVNVIEEITMSTVEYIKSKGMSLIFDTDVEEKVIGVDRENMERVMLNLLSNAVKFSKENGEIFVKINDLGDKIRISVKDNGIGIPKKMQTKIFDRFVQSESLFTRTHEGSGIGLSLVKSIIEAHNGTIYVESKLNKGSEFIIELPCVMAKEDNNKIYKESTSDDRVQKIQVEFSDIYK